MVPIALVGSRNQSKLTAMQQTFQGLRPVSQFADNLRRVLELYSAPDDFWSPGRVWLRDAHSAAHFAKKTCARNVGLIAAERPDFEVEYRNGIVLRFETTLADRPNRKYREECNSAPRIRSVPESELFARRNEIPNALWRAAVKKSRKHYEPNVHLLIYLNLGTHDFWRREIESELIEHTRPAREYFRSIWVLWSGRLYRTWPEPFLGHDNAFRPSSHKLGWALEVYASQKCLDEVFSSTRKRDRSHSSIYA